MEYYKVYSTWAKRILRLDKDLVPGPFEINCSWCYKPMRRKTGEPVAYADDCDEIIGLFGHQYEDPRKIGAETKFWSEDEPPNIIESALLFPGCMKHYPPCFKTGR